MVKFVLSVFALPLLVAIPSSMAHMPEDYGREYVRLQDQANSALGEGLMLTSPMMQPSEYEAQLEHMLESAGPYASGLADPLVIMGHYYLGRGDIEEALETYQRALHLVRINDGLYSERQLPVLREMMAIYRLVGDYETLDGAHQYYYRLRKFDEAPPSQEWLESGLEYIAWERQLYLFQATHNKRAPLMRAHELNERMLQSLSPTSNQELEWYSRLCLSQMHNLYLIMGEDPLSMRASINAGNEQALITIDREFAYVQLTAQHKGQSLLESCIKTAQLGPPSTLAALHLALGDWHQWNENLSRASEQYTRVVEILSTAGEQQLLLQWLDEPVELPAVTDQLSASSGLELADQVVVEAQYDVSSRGDVKRIVVSVADEGKAWHGWRVKRMLREAHFRPRFSAGHAEMAEQVSRRYILINPH